jgi:hypothetical protein
MKYQWDGLSDRRVAQSTSKLQSEQNTILLPAREVLHFRGSEITNRTAGCMKVLKACSQVSWQSVADGSNKTVIIKYLSKLNKNKKKGKF